MVRGIRLVVLVAALFVPPSVAGAQPFIRSAVPDEANQTLTISGLNVGPAPPLVFLDLQSLDVLSVSGAQVVTALPPGLAPGTYSLILVQGSEFALSEVTLGGVGSLTAPPLGDAVDFRSFASAPLSLAASSFRATTATEEQQTFVWRADPVGHGTKDPSGRLNLLFAPGGGLPLPTGLGIHEDGTFSFSPGQTFPGAVTDVSAGQGLSRGGSSDQVFLGVRADGILGSMIASGTVRSADIADGVVGSADLAVLPTPQLNLDQHRSGSNHDTRYYWETLADPIFETKWTKLDYDDAAFEMTPQSSFKQLMIVGDFLSTRAPWRALVIWSGSVGKRNFIAANNFCEFQVRVSGQLPPPGTGTAYTLLDAMPVHVTATFTGSSLGNHFVTIWSRGNADVCTINPESHPQVVLVKESGG